MFFFNVFYRLLEVNGLGITGFYLGTSPHVGKLTILYNFTIFKTSTTTETLPLQVNAELSVLARAAATPIT